MLARRIGNLRLVFNYALRVRDDVCRAGATLVRDDQRIHVEDLNIGGMIENPHMARVISEAGRGRFARIIGEKADRYGRIPDQASHG